jgi:hypothetical protein
VSHTARVLNAAADLIEQRGWSQYKAFGPQGELCPVAAIITAATESPPYGRALDLLRAHAETRNLAYWNSCQPDASTVVGALREVAQKADQ